MEILITINVKMIKDTLLNLSLMWRTMVNTYGFDGKEKCMEFASK